MRPLPSNHPAIAPLKQLSPDAWLLELFHGPTLAFKDFALQLLGRLLDHFLAERGERGCYGCNLWRHRVGGH